MKQRVFLVSSEEDVRREIAKDRFRRRLREGGFGFGFNRGIAVGSPPPVITTLNYALDDVLGGGTIVINGTGLSGATAATFGAASAGIVGSNDTQLTVTVPANTAGLYNVQVTGAAGGLSNVLTNAFRAWAPSTLGSTVKLFCEKPNYAVGGGTGTWTTRVGTAPSETTVEPSATNGEPDFNGAGQRIAGPAWSTLASLGAGTAFAGFAADAETAAADAPYDDTGIIGMVSAGYVILAFNSGGLRVACYDGAYKEVTTFGGSLIGGSYHLAGIRWDGSTLRGVLDGGTFSSNSVATTGPNDLSYILNIGGNYNLTDTLDGRIRFIITLDTAISDADKTNTYLWGRVRHGLAA